MSRRRFRHCRSTFSSKHLILISNIHPFVPNYRLVIQPPASHVTEEPDVSYHVISAHIGYFLSFHITGYHFKLNPVVPNPFTRHCRISALGVSHYDTRVYTNITGPKLKDHKETPKTCKGMDCTVQLCSFLNFYWQV
jgi:hypothetical protein